MLVEKQGSLERATPKRWNLVVLVVGILAVATVASLQAEPQSQPNANEAAPANSAAEQDSISETHNQPPKGTPIARPMLNGRLLTEAERLNIEQKRANDPQLQILRHSLNFLMRLDKSGEATSSKTLAGEIEGLRRLLAHREVQVAMPAALNDPPRERIEAEIAQDPQILELTQNLGKITKALNRLLASPPKKETTELVSELTWEALRIEEKIEERKAELRPRVIESLGGPVQGSATPHVQPLQEAQTQRFMLGEGVRVVQNQATTAVRRAPFSGKIRPGDILNIEIVGGIPTTSADAPKTVEPDGNVAIGAVYRDVGRIQIGGLSLIEAGKHIASKLRAVLKEPIVMVTYVGHDPEVVATGEASEAAGSSPTPPVEPVVLAPLDTIEVRLGAKSPYLDSINGMYLIEPDGRIDLFEGRLKLAGLTELEAGNAIRTYCSQRPGQRKAPPSINIVRRGRAVFPADKQPAAEYRVRAGDHLLLNRGFSPADGMSYEVTADGMLQANPDFNGIPYEPVHVAGLTLDEVQKVLRESWKTLTSFGRGNVKTDPQEQPWLVTIGGWHEEADPQLIDRLGDPNDPRVEQLERELQQIKTMIHAQ